MATPAPRDDVTEVVHRWLGERALGALDVEALLAKDVEDGAELLQVFCPRCAVDEDVIKEYKYAPAEEWLEDEVHERLERGRRI